MAISFSVCGKLLTKLDFSFAGKFEDRTMDYQVMSGNIVTAERID